MGEGYVKTILEVLKLAPRKLIPFGLVAAFLLFDPDAFRKSPGIYQFAENYRPYLILFVLVTGGSLATNLAEQIVHRVRNRIQARKVKKGQLKRLHGLTENEKQILRFYIYNETRTNYLRIDDGVVQGLVSAGIIYRAAFMGNPFEFAHNISDFAWDYLHENIGLLEGETTICRTDKRKRGG
jgi:hypothetical protein